VHELMPMEKGRACERCAEYEYGGCKPPTRKWPEECHVTQRESGHVTRYTS